MIKKNKLIGIIELNWFIFFIMLIFCIFGYKIYYLTIPNYFRSYRLIKFLEKFNFYWLSYQEYEREKEYYNKTISKKISYKISKEITKKIWNKDLMKKFKKDSFLTLCIYERILKDVKLIHELSLHLKKISKNKKVLIWADSFEFIDLYLKNQSKITNLCPSSFLYLLILSKYLLKVFNLILNNFFNLFKIKNKPIKNKLIKNQKINFGKYEYIFFPKGIIESFFPKDYILSSEKESGLTNKNLLVVELDKRDIEGKHKKYLTNKNFKYSLWNNINFSLDKIKLKEILKLYWKTLIYTKNLTSSNLILKILILNEKNLSNFKKLYKLKYIFLGHEALMPLNIQVSALICDIKIISYQTRSQVSFPFEPLISNYYFTFSKKLKSEVKKNNFIFKENFSLSIGNYKKDQNDYLLKESFKIKKKLQNNYKYICSVWDYPCALNWYSNGRQTIGNYKRNKILLVETLILAKSFPTVLFLIKSKNLNWTNLSYFNEIYLKIKKTKNIVISDMSYIHALNISDLGYGNYTSALDQMIFLNKPIVIRNYYNNFEDKLYVKEMISYNFNDSYKKILYILNNLSQAPIKQIKTKNAIFDNKIKNISSEIIKIINPLKTHQFKKQTNQ